MNEMDIFKNLNVEKKVLKPFKVENKLFYPVVEIITLGDENSFNSLNIAPIAFLVEKNDEKYVIQITEYEIDDNEIFELVL
jgi:hypothetical protein